MDEPGRFGAGGGSDTNCRKNGTINIRIAGGDNQQLCGANQHKKPKTSSQINNNNNNDDGRQSLGSASQRVPAYYDWQCHIVAGRAFGVGSSRTAQLRTITTKTYFAHQNIRTLSRSRARE